MQKLGPRIRIQAATPLEGSSVLCQFENGVQKEIDLTPFLKGEVFEPIRTNREFFEDIHIVGGTIAWANGADIDPDVLYYGLTPAWMEKIKVF